MALRSNPDARSFAVAADHRLEDAEILLANRRTNGAVYLAGYSVECVLKALILGNTTPRQRPGVVRELKETYGHDLEAHRREAARRGAHMTREVRAEFRLVNTWQTSLRYEPRLQSEGDAGRLVGAAVAVVHWAKRAGRSTNG